MTETGPRPSRPGRTWPERLAITGTIVIAVISFLAAGTLVAGYVVVRNREVVRITNPAEAAAASTTTTAAAAPGPTSTLAPGQTAAPVAPTTPPETFPPADPAAKNFLLTGGDNGACVDPNSPYAPAFGDAESGRVGERSDTIMVFRVDPAAERVAVLSFPRDLYVKISDSNGRSRINSAYRRDDPQRLINTIYENFGIGIDHYIQVDFCTFKTLVDAVGGVTVPFQYPARDPNTGLNVPTTGCFTFDGDHALAYVRSRHYEYEDPPGSGDWKTDGTSDLGRISRQQDFLRRTLSSVLAKGFLNPSVARGMISAATGGNVVTDNTLTLAKLMEFAGVLRDVEPDSIPSYQIEAVGRRISGASVLEPRIDGENMQAVLAMFRGETSLADAPVQSFEPTTSAPPASTPSDGTPADTPATTPPATEAAPDTSAAPATGPAENNIGIVPPRDVDCGGG
jgi:LCP family protein required for cell wall assembly